MVTTVEILKAMAITTFTVRQRITDKVITTGVTTDVVLETITLIIKKIIVFTGVSNATDHIDIDAMIADS